MTMEPSIFTGPLRSRTNSREDYLTECFAGLLRIWHRDDPEGFHRFIVWFSNADPKGALCEIVTQRGAGKYGRPDLWIIFEDALILAENKWDALPNDDQIVQYHDFLDYFRSNHPSITTFLVFMNPSIHSTRWTRAPDRDITWMEIGKNISQFDCSGRLVLRYYLTQFYQFLEDHKMIDKPVSWQYQEGIPALLTMVNSIQMVLVELAKEGLVCDPTISSGSKFAGCLFYSANKENRFWFGQVFGGNYDCLSFETPVLNTWKLPETGFEIFNEDKQYAGRKFILSEHFFFSRDAQGQREELKLFIKETLGLFVKP